MMESATWDPQDHQGLQASTDDDFQQFLNIGNMGPLGDGLHFEFQDFPASSHGTLLSQAPPREQMDTPMGGTDNNVLMDHRNNILSGQMAALTAVSSHQSIPPQLIPASLPTPADAIVAIDAQIQFLQQAKLQQQQQQIQDQTAFFSGQSHNVAVPPTPQSMELPPNGHQFYSPDIVSQQPSVFENRYQRLRDQADMAFTPLVSPAVTPLDPTFPVEQSYTVPGAYFSPLTSPALHAQNDPIMLYEPRTSNGTRKSPGTTDIDPALGEVAKKTRKTTVSKPTTRKSGVRQSPIVKAQKRKSVSQPARVSKALNEVAEAEASANNGDQERGQSSGAGSELMEEDGSVSPEALSDMPPPPIPSQKAGAGTQRSPFIRPQTSAQPAAGFAPKSTGKPSPATPATLMKLPVSSASSSTASNPVDPPMMEAIESFQLPEAAATKTMNSKPKLSPIDTNKSRAASTSQADVGGPSGSTSTPFQPLPSPIFTKPLTAASASQSPQLLPGGSSTPSHRMTPQLLARGSTSGGSKKRSGVGAGSVHVSPALRPRISPNIKPNIPGMAGGGIGSSAEDTASRLLASKSNYQNILEGNTVPGVSYPSELSTNLTSKRTSHKIAEQGRRNRINSALAEIATLLPNGGVKEGQRANSEEDDGGEGNDEKKGGAKGASSAAPNSKASTVEMAIEYIKQLQQELSLANKRAEEAEKQLQAQREAS